MGVSTERKTRPPRTGAAPPAPERDCTVAPRCRGCSPKQGQSRLVPTGRGCPPEPGIPNGGCCSMWPGPPCASPGERASGCGRPPAAAWVTQWKLQTIERGRWKSRQPTAGLGDFGMSTLCRYGMGNCASTGFWRGGTGCGRSGVRFWDRMFDFDGTEPGWRGQEARPTSGHPGPRARWLRPLPRARRSHRGLRLSGRRPEWAARLDWEKRRGTPAPRDRRS